MDFILRRVRYSQSAGLMLPLAHPLAFQPESYKKKKEFVFGRTLGKGTFGEVKEATWTTRDSLQVAIKVILKKSVKGQHQIIYDEIDVLQGLNHPNIGEWFVYIGHSLLVN